VHVLRANQHARVRLELPVRRERHPERFKIVRRYISFRHHCTTLPLVPISRFSSVALCDPTENLTKIRKFRTLLDRLVKSDAKRAFTAGQVALPSHGTPASRKEKKAPLSPKKSGTAKEAKPLSRIQEANRKAILDAALDVFAKSGFRGATIDEIAGKAGMSKPNLLYYFKSKRAIYQQVLEQTLSEWLTPFAELDPNGDPVEELRRYITAKLKMSESNPNASKLFANEVIHGAPVISDFLTTSLKALVDEKAKVIRKWVGEGKLAPIDPYHLIFTIWATTQHYADFDVQIRAVIGTQAGKPGFHEQAAQAVLSIILHGIKPR
jgi:TetR/AcrR family transcriptional regulator